MSLATGFNHAAIVTQDLDRFVGFYTAIFDAEIIFEEDIPGLHHAMVRIGDGVLHAVASPANPHARGGSALLDRGHLDHLGLNVADEAAFDEVRARLRRLGAAGDVVHDLGPQLSLWFTDPDGMAVEVCWNRDPSLAGFHAPVPIERP